MNISNLYPGLIIKNYKHLCTILEVPLKTSTDSKKALYKELERYCTYTKQGHKIIINEMFTEPLPKQDHRKDTDKIGNNSKYTEHVKVLLLHKLSQCKGHKYTITKDNLFESLGMVNPEYLDKSLVIIHFLN